MVAQSNPYERSYGSTYDKTLTTTQIAKLVRAKIRDYTKSGRLPKGLKVSVRSEYFANGSSIGAKITAMPFPIFNENRLRAEIEYPNDVAQWPREAYSPRALRVLAEIKALMAGYNHDGSDIQTDYWDVKFYSSIQFDWHLTIQEKEAMRERLRVTS